MFRGLFSRKPAGEGAIDNTPILGPAIQDSSEMRVGRLHGHTVHPLLVSYYQMVESGGRLEDVLIEERSAIRLLAERVQLYKLSKELTLPPPGSKVTSSTFVSAPDPSKTGCPAK